MTARTSRRSGPRSHDGRGVGGTIFSPRARLIVLCAFLLLVFFTGGSSRADMPALLVLRPVALLVLGYGLVTLSRTHVAQHKAIALIAAAAVALPVLQLVPLPPGIWQALPGREGIAAIDGFLGFDNLWRPLTLDPQATRNALMALAVPCAVLVLAVQLDPRDHEIVLTIVLALGALSAVWALLQLMGNPRGPLYLYSVTNHGWAVGLFANRNHQGVFLASMIPLAYCWAMLGGGAWRDLRSPRGRRAAIAAACVLLFVPLILIGGSRAGLLTLVLSLCATAALAAVTLGGRGRRRDSRSARLLRFVPVIAGLTAIAGLGLLTGGMGRDLAFERLISADPVTDLRNDVLPLVWAIARDHFPAGVGMGAFDDVFRSAEPDALLSPTYVNHAHNDLLELTMAGGLAGTALMVAAIGLLTIRAGRVFVHQRGKLSTNILPAGALVALAILLIASLVDYPLRTPALAVYAVLLALWTGERRAQEAQR